MFRKLALALTAVIAVAGLGAGGLYWHLLQWSDAPMSGDPLHLILEQGESLSSLAAQLHTAGVTSEGRLLSWLGRLTGADTRLQAGEYLIPAASTPRQMLDQLTGGDVLNHEFRIEEGVTVAAMLANLAAETRLQQDVVATDVEALHAELALSTPFAEGMFFPDTYQFQLHGSARALLLRAHEAMRQMLDEAWRNRSPETKLSSRDDLVVLASLIEKETGLAADRGQISQVFHARLAQRMLLQTDPTVIYALGQAFDGNLTRAHLQIDSPFNTYRYRGLPPTPIALPSAASLQAAVHPAPGDYLYFVAKGDGASYFSRTLAEHNAAVRRYQLKRTGT